MATTKKITTKKILSTPSTPSKQSKPKKRQSKTWTLSKYGLDIFFFVKLPNFLVQLNEPDGISLTIKKIDPAENILHRGFEVKITWRN